MFMRLNRGLRRGKAGGNISFENNNPLSHIVVKVKEDNAFESGL